MAKKPTRPPKGLKIAGSIGTTKYYYTKDGLVVDDKGTPVNGRIVAAFDTPPVAPGGTPRVKEEKPVKEKKPAQEKEEKPAKEKKPVKEKEKKSIGRVALETAFPETFSTIEKLRKAFKEKNEKEEQEKKRERTETRYQFETIEDYLKENNNLLKEQLAVQERTAMLIERLLYKSSGVGSILPKLPNLKPSGLLKFLGVGAAIGAAKYGIDALLGRSTTLTPTAEGTFGKDSAMAAKTPEQSREATLRYVEDTPTIGGYDISGDKSKKIKLYEQEYGEGSYAKDTEEYKKSKTEKNYKPTYSKKIDTTPKNITSKPQLETPPVSSEQPAASISGSAVTKPTTLTKPNANIPEQNKTAAIAEAEKRGQKPSNTIEFKADKINLTAKNLTFNVKKLKINVAGAAQQVFSGQPTASGIPKVTAPSASPASPAAASGVSAAASAVQPAFPSAVSSQRVGTITPAGVVPSAGSRISASADKSTTQQPNEPVKAGPPGKFRPVYEGIEKDLADPDLVNIIGREARNNTQSIDAVINNMMNRLGSKSYGNAKSLSEVAKQRNQYEAWNFLQSGRFKPVTGEQRKLIEERLRLIASGSMPDTTNGADQYRASSYVKGAGAGKTFARQAAAQGAPDIGGNVYVKGKYAAGPFAAYEGVAPELSGVQAGATGVSTQSQRVGTITPAGVTPSAGSRLESPAGTMPQQGLATPSKNLRMEGGWITAQGDKNWNQCASLSKAFNPNVGRASGWKVDKNAQILPGSMIASTKYMDGSGGKPHSGYHTGIALSSPDKNGNFLILDQWAGRSGRASVRQENINGTIFGGQAGVVMGSKQSLSALTIAAQLTDNKSHLEQIQAGIQGLHQSDPTLASRETVNASHAQATGATASETAGAQAHIDGIETKKPIAVAQSTNQPPTPLKTTQPVPQPTVQPTEQYPNLSGLQEWRAAHGKLGPEAQAAYRAQHAEAVPQPTQPVPEEERQQISQAGQEVGQRLAGTPKPAPQPLPEPKQQSVPSWTNNPSNLVSSMGAYSANYFRQLSPPKDSKGDSRGSVLETKTPAPHLQKKAIYSHKTIKTRKPMHVDDVPSTLSSGSMLG